MAHYTLASSSITADLICISSVGTVCACTCDMLICGVDLAGRDSRPDGGLPEVQVTGVNTSESGAPAAGPATTPNSTPAVAHAAQGPAPVPITAAGPSVAMPGEAPTVPFAVSGLSSVFGFGSTGADRHAGQAASDEAPEAQDAGMLLSHLCVFACGHAACLHHGPAEQCILHMDP